MSSKLAETSPVKIQKVKGSIILAVIAIFIFTFLVYFNISGVLLNLLQKHKQTFVDDIVLTAIAFVSAFGIFLLHRLQVMKKENRERTVVKEALDESQKRFQSAFDYAIAKVLVAPDGRFLQVNHDFCDLVGYTREELLATNFQSLTHPDDVAASHENIRRLLDHEIQTVQLEKRYIHRLGYEVIALTSLSLVRDTQNNPLYIMAQIQDITERRQTEKALEESESKFRNLVETLPAIVYRASPHPPYCTLYISPGIESLGYSAEEWYQSPDLWVSLLHPDDRDRILQETRKAMEAGQENNYEYRIIARDGSMHWLHDRGRFIRDEGGRLMCWQGIMVDISESKRLEEMVYSSDSRYRMMFENNPLPMWVFDIETLAFLAVNEAAVHHYGYSQEEFLTITLKDIRPIEDFQSFLDELSNNHLEVNSAGTWRHRKKDGSVIYVDIRTHRIKFAGKQAKLVVAQDVTERKQTEEALRQSEERYRTIIEEMSDAYWEMDLKGKFSYFNEQLIELHQRSKEELTGLSYKTYMGQETAQRVYQAYNQLYRTGAHVKGLIHEQFKRDGTLTYVESNISLIRNGNGEPVGFRGISRDITERKRTEVALQYSRDYLDSIINTIADPIFVIDQQHRFVLLNDAFCNLVGQTREVMIGKTVAVYCPPDEAQATIEKDNIVFADGGGKSHDDHFTDWQGNHHIILTRKAVYEAQDGEKFLVGVIRDITELKKTEEALKFSEERYRTIIEEMTDSYWEIDLAANFTFFNNQVMIEQKRSREELLALKQNNNPHIDEENRKKVAKAYHQLYLTGETIRGLTYENIRSDGTKYTIESNVSLMRSKEGKPVGFRGISRDITKRIQIEQQLQRAKESAEAGNRAKSEFLANMSHEIRTPMNGVIGMTGLLLDTDLTDDQREFAETIRTSGDALLTIINDILDFSKIEAGKLQFENLDFDLNHAVEGTVELLAEKANEKEIEFASLIYSDVPSQLCGDPGRLRQVLTNLIGNAIKFTDRGEVIVKVEKETETDSLVVIRFTVSDSGIGINEEVQRNLFQPFIQADGSTTRKYGGTGLGLVISKQLVELMGGEIGVTSQPGKGSTFWFTAQFGKQVETLAFAQPQVTNLGNLRALIVDDNATNRKILSHQLSSWGLLHEEAAGGMEALNLMRARTAENRSFDLAVLDFLMPEMDGFELALAIKADASIASLPIILLTSYGQREHGAQAREAGVAAYLAKPIRQTQLFECLTNVISQRAFTTKAQDLPDSEILKVITRHNLPDRQRGSNKLILLAEDNIVNQKIAVRQLQSLGYRTDAVANGQEVLEALERIPYDLVLMDCQMPEMDGYEATAAIRRREGDNKHTLIVAMTAHALEGDREKCIAAGMDDYISKPVRSKILSDILERLLVDAVQR